MPAFRARNSSPYYNGLKDAEVRGYAGAIISWRKYALKTIKRTKKPRYLTETSRSYTSQDSVLTEEEFWAYNDRTDETRRDRSNILPAEVYRLCKKWKPDDVILSVSSILGIQLSGPQKNQREGMSLHLVMIRSLCSVCSTSGRLIRRPYVLTTIVVYVWNTTMIAHHSAQVIVVFNSDGSEKFQSVLAVTSGPGRARAQHERL